MLEAPLCPICSAAPFQCDHEVLRWWYSGSEYEDSFLEAAVREFSRVVEERLQLAWRRKETPTSPLLKGAYEVGLEFSGEDYEPWELLAEAGEQIQEYVLATLRVLPGVVEQEDGETLVFYSTDRNRVRNELADRTRVLEIEMAKEPE